MSTLKQLRLRIAGVKSTQKITRTMKMVAVSKLVKAQESRDQAKPYAKKLNDMLHQIIDSIDIESNQLLAGNGRDKKHLLLVVSTDRGLCGAFNSSLTKELKKQIEFFQREGKEYKIICVGKKVFDQIKILYSQEVMEVLPGLSGKKVEFGDARLIALKLIDLFEKGEFDYCHVIYNEFKNALKQVVTIRQLIPVNKKEQEKTLAISSYEFEPGEEKILKELLPRILASQLYYYILESAASEHGARMTAMDSATNNASDMIASLTLKYNRSRQATITKELIEIVSSAEVV